MESTEEQQFKLDQERKKSALLRASEAAALQIWCDRNRVLAFLAALAALPALTALGALPHNALFYVDVVQRGVQLAILAMIVKSFLARVRPDTRFVSENLGSYFLFGFTIWVVVTILSQQIFAANQFVALLSMLILGPALVFAVRTFFYHFFFFVSPPDSIKNLLVKSQLPVIGRTTLVFRIIWIAGCANYFLSAVAFMYDPVEQSVAGVLAHQVFAGSYWIISSYLSLSYCVEFFVDENDAGYVSNANQIQMYAAAPKWLSYLLKPGFSFRWLTLAVILYGVSFARIANTPPTSVLSVTSMQVADQVLHIRLSGSDPVYRHRGLKPYAFRVASDAGTSLYRQLPFPKEVKINDQEVGMTGIPAARLSEQVTIDLTFATSRTAEELVQLRDVYLWYLNQRHLFLDLTQASIVSDSKTPEKEQ